MGQRGLRIDEVEMIRQIGTEVEGGYLVRQKDFQAFDCELRRMRARARRLVGKRVVIKSGNIVTVYHANANKQRRLLRRVENRSLD